MIGLSKIETRTEFVLCLGQGLDALNVVRLAQSGYEARREPALAPGPYFFFFRYSGGALRLVARGVPTCNAEMRPNGELCFILPETLRGLDPRRLWAFAAGEVAEDFAIAYARAGLEGMCGEWN